MQTQSLESGKLYLRLFHGRQAIDEHLDGWGFEGPTIGPLDFVHVTYLSDVKFSAAPAVMDCFFPEVMAEWRAKGYSNAKGPRCDWQFDIEGDLIRYQDAYYGDWSVFLAGPEPDRSERPDHTTAPAVSPAVREASDDGGRHPTRRRRSSRSTSAQCEPLEGEWDRGRCRSGLARSGHLLQEPIMDLIPNDIREALLANTDRLAANGNDDPVPVVKLFTPDAGGTWLMTRAEPYGADLMLYGLADLGLGCPEFGPTLLSELTAYRGVFGFPVERDLFFEPHQPISRYISQAMSAGYVQA